MEESMDEQDETGESYKKIIIKKIRTLGTKGDMIAIKELFNRMDGMPKQSTDLTTNGKDLEAVLVKFINNENDRDTE